MLRHVTHGRPFDPHRDVVPADAAPGAVIRCVVGIAAVECEVDASDVRDPVVDHDRLLVMAVRRSRAGIERGPDLRMAGERALHLAHVPARGSERRDRRALPEQDAYVDLLGQLGQQDPDDERLLLAAERQLGREEPAGEVHVGGRRRHVGRHPGQRLRAVDQHLDRVPVAGRRALGEVERRRVQGVLLADAPQVTPVPVANRPVDLTSERMPELDAEVLEDPAAGAPGRRPSRPARTSALWTACRRPFRDQSFCRSS